MAEAILRAVGGPRFAAFSAGMQPAAALDPHALSILEQRGISSQGLVPKGLHAFEGQSFDYVITLSDRTREQAPVFAGVDVMHWSFVDPELSFEEHMDPHPFEHLFAGLTQRIRLFLIITERSEREGLHGTQLTR